MKRKLDKKILCGGTGHLKLKCLKDVLLSKSKNKRGMDRTQGCVQGGAKGHNRTPKQIAGGAIAPPGRSPPLFQAAHLDFLTYI